MKIFNFSVDFCISLPESEAVDIEDIKRNIAETIDCYRGADDEGKIWDIRIRKTHRPVPNEVKNAIEL